MTLPGRNRALDPDGYVYVIQFSDDVTKVGMTLSPAARLGTHVRDASKRGAVQINSWISPAHRGYGGTEGALIAAASAMGRPARGAEYFYDCDFDALVAVAAAMEMRTSTREEREKYLSAWQNRATPMWMLADHLVEGGIEEFIAGRRAAKASWYDLALDLYLVTNGGVKVTPETIRGWTLSTVAAA